METENPLILALALLILTVHTKAVGMLVVGLVAHYLGKYLLWHGGFRFTSVLLQMTACLLTGAVATGFLLAGFFYEDAPFAFGGVLLSVPVVWAGRALLDAVFRRRAPAPPFA